MQIDYNSLRPLEGNGKKLYIETYGCQMNFGDSEILLSIMQEEGWRYCEDIEEADLILVNTCSIRDNAEQRIWGRLNEFKRYKRKKPSLMIGIIGCMRADYKSNCWRKNRLLTLWWDQTPTESYPRWCALPKMAPRVSMYCCRERRPMPKFRL